MSWSKASGSPKVIWPTRLLKYSPFNDHCICLYSSTYSIFLKGKSRQFAIFNTFVFLHRLDICTSSTTTSNQLVPTIYGVDEDYVDRGTTTKSSLCLIPNIPPPWQLSVHNRRTDKGTLLGAVRESRLSLDIGRIFAGHDEDCILSLLMRCFSPIYWPSFSDKATREYCSLSCPSTPQTKFDIVVNESLINRRNCPCFDRSRSRHNKPQ